LYKAQRYKRVDPQECEDEVARIFKLCTLWSFVVVLHAPSAWSLGT